MTPPATSARTSTCIALAALMCIMAGCSKNGIRYYKLGSTRLFNASDTGHYAVLSLTDTIPARVYAIGVAFTATLSGTTSEYNSDDPTENHFQSRNPPAMVNVYSLSDFDAAHAALSSLNDLFFGEVGYNPAAPLNPAEIDPDVGYSYTTSKTGDTSSGYSYLILMAIPTAPGERTFVVNITYADSTKVSDTITAWLQ